MKKFYLLIFLVIGSLQAVKAQKGNDFETKTKGLTKYTGYFNFYWNEICSVNFRSQISSFGNDWTDRI